MDAAPESDRAVCRTCGLPLSDDGRCLPCLLRLELEETVRGASAALPVVFGDFEIALREDGSLWELGRGGMGVTYRAVDRVLHRSVALKVTEVPQGAGGAAIRERFLREARAAAALRHANIAGIYQFGASSVPPCCYYAMELVEGETLAARVQREGPLDAQIVLEIGRQVAAALKAAADRGLIHRDLKPGNLMLTHGEGGDLEVKVIDFGLAKASVASDDERDLTQGAFVGTPVYASPEQLDRRVVDARSDIYSLGVTLWFALTGRVPFAAQSIHAIRHLQEQSELPVAQLTSRRVPPPVIALLRSLLAVHAAERPASARELIAALQSCRQELELTVGHTTTGGASRTQSESGQYGSETNRQRITSLAVKPLDDLSEGVSKSYFADGMTDELITKLSQIRALERVISRSTMMKYKQSTKSVPEIAQELKVEAVLEGSLLVSGDYVRVSAQLIEAATDQTLWADSYTRSLSNVLLLQNEVALAIAEAVQLKLTPAEKQRLSARDRVNPQAYDYYLRGRNAYGQDSAESSLRIDALEKSVLLDDTFAEAQAQLSIAYSSRAYFLAAGAKQWEIKAEAALARALELNPELPSALLAQARLVWRPTTGFQHEKAIELVCRALAVAANSADAHMFLGAIYFHVGLIDDALRHFRRADGLTPGDAMIGFNIGYMMLLLGRSDDALRLMEDHVSGMVRAFVEYNIACALLSAGRREAARQRIENAKGEFKDEGGILTAMQALFFALDGAKAQCEEKIRESISLGEGFGHFHHTTHVIASAYALLDQPDDAIHWLHYTVENGYPNLPLLEGDPHLAKLHGEPRFLALLDMLRLRFQRFRALADRWSPLTDDGLAGTRQEGQS